MVLRQFSSSPAGNVLTFLPEPGEAEGGDSTSATDLLLAGWYQPLPSSWKLHVGPQVGSHCVLSFIGGC